MAAFDRWCDWWERRGMSIRTQQFVFMFLPLAIVIIAELIWGKV